MVTFQSCLLIELFHYLYYLFYLKYIGTRKKNMVIFPKFIITYMRNVSVTTNSANTLNISMEIVRIVCYRSWWRLLLWWSCFGLRFWSPPTLGSLSWTPPCWWCQSKYQILESKGYYQLIYFWSFSLWNYSLTTNKCSDWEVYWEREEGHGK